MASKGDAAMSDYEKSRQVSDDDIPYAYVSDINKAEDEYLKPNQSAKADAGKPMLTLVPPQIMFEIEKIRQHGNNKYGDPDNWKTVSPQRYWEAIIRHVFAAWDDYKAKDPESGQMHLSHIACNCAFILQMIKWEEDGNGKQK